MHRYIWSSSRTFFQSQPSARYSKEFLCTFCIISVDENHSCSRVRFEYSDRLGIGQTATSSLKVSRFGVLHAVVLSLEENDALGVSFDEKDDEQTVATDSGDTVALFANIEGKDQPVLRSSVSPELSELLRASLV